MGLGNFIGTNVIFLLFSKNPLDILPVLSYTPRIRQGYGVIGNTSVSGTAIRGSSPCSPKKRSHSEAVALFLMRWGKRFSPECEEMCR